MSGAKKKVAIVGGGCAAMSAAYYLSRTPELRDELEVTVYQIGWRLGGKGASGRNLEMNDRIEEHGLHVWGGFYYNAFRMMREAYGALGRPEGAPLATVDEAFIPHNRVCWEEQIEGEWLHWPIETPLTRDKPGEGADHPSVIGYVEMLVGWIRTVVEDFPHETIRAAANGKVEQHHFRGVDGLLGGDFNGAPSSALEVAHQTAKKAAAADEPLRAVHHHRILGGLGWFHDWLKKEWMHLIVGHDEARRLFILIDLAQAVVRGVLRDGVLTRGFMAIDEYDLVEWLGRHGATELARTSAPVRGYYDYFFAYENGDPSKPRMSAGMGLWHLLRLICDFRGSLFYKMGSGMGDAVFGPIYEVCRSAGVKFRFFHRVEELVPDESGSSIDAVRIAKQVDLKKGEEYDPLVDIGGLPSWPSDPLWDQINPEQARELRERKVSLENPFADWDDVGQIVLKRGEDFDAIVLGVSLGSIPYLCGRLIDASDDWAKMVANLQSIQTQSMQLWWKPPVDELGFEMGNVTGTAYGQPMESWSDMSFVKARESWPAEEVPQTIIYFTGPMLNPDSMPSGKDPGYGEKETEKAWSNALEWSRSFVGHLYPKAMDGDDLDWSKLVDTSGAEGEARFRAQYVRSNFPPSERYVVDLPGTNKYRLEAGSSGYDNLALAGDWLFTGLGGAVESAVIAGMQAAEALTGEGLDIRGAMKSPWARPRSVKPLTRKES